MLKLGILLYVLKIIDLATTYYVVSMSSLKSEANPVFQWVMGQVGVELGLFLNLLFFSGIFVCIWKDAKKYNRKVCFVVGIIIMSAVAINNLAACFIV